MRKRKVCVVLFSRTNYARVKSALVAIRKNKKLELQLVVGASALLDRFGSVIDVIRRDGFKIDQTAYIIVEGENPTTMAKSTGLAILELATIFENLKPNIVLTVGDRFDTMATAIAASYMNITLAHTQAGELSGSIDESVRHAITKMAHLHFVSNLACKNRLVKMGEDPKFIYITGCPSIDLITDLNMVLPSDLFEKYKGVGATLDFSKPYIVTLQHPVTTEYGQARKQIEETLKAIYNLKLQTAWLWPNVDAGSDDISRGIRVFREKYRPPFIHFFKNFSPEDYARLIYNCKCVVGNSSSGIREASYLGVPAVNIGTRQSGRERGENVIDVDYDIRQIEQAIKKQIKHGRYKNSHIYGNGKAGERIARILANCKVRVQKKNTY